MTDAAKTRLAQASALFSALQGMWPLLAIELESQRASLVSSLIAADDEQLRGKIKFIDDLLVLPHSLRQEMQNLSESLPDQGDS